MRFSAADWVARRSGKHLRQLPVIPEQVYSELFDEAKRLKRQGKPELRKPERY